MSTMMMIVGGRPGSGPGVHVRRILSDPRSESSVAPREGEAALHFCRWDKLWQEDFFLTPDSGLE